MKRIIIIFISLLAIIGCVGQESHNETDLQKGGLKGNIKSIESTKYTAYEKFGQVQKDEFIGRSIFSYNKKGNLTEGNDYDINGELLFKGEDTYDERGNKLEQVMYNSYGKLLHKVTYKYDDKGNRTEEKDYDSNGKLTIRVTYAHNEMGNKTEENVFPSDNKPYQIKYKYNDKGEQIEQVENSKIEDIDIEVKLTTKYDSKGNKVEEENFFNDKLTSKKLYKYDQKGNKIEESFIGFSTEPSKKTLYSYDNKNNLTELNDFDANNNLIKRIVYRNDEKGNAIEEKHYEWLES